MRIALLLSGSGTTMEAIIKASLRGVLAGVDPVLVIASIGSAGGIPKAQSLGIKEEDILILNPKSFENSEKFGEAIINACRERKVDLVGQYGWMVKTPHNVCKEFEGRIVNQHPGPLDPNGNGDFGGPGMYGIRVHETRLQFVRKTNREFWTEATCHYVTENFDEGKIIKTMKVEILPEDTAESLQERVLKAEHKVQIEALQDFVNNKIEIFNREVPLVLPGEESILAECKQNAIAKYPKK
jgi:phosphoribosylglycinamide formyltransferase-1